MINSSFDIVRTKKTVEDLDLKQLLGRSEVIFDPEPITQYLKGKRVLITGAAGSVGSELFRQISARQPEEIILIDQSATLLNSCFEVPQSSAKVSKFAVNICSMSAIHQIFSEVRPDLVFHAAALKHVPLVEKMHLEAVHINIIGTEIVAKAALQTGVQKFVFVSTDKAVNPTSFMGATKRFGEMMMTDFNGRNTQFVTARFGNILGSSDSVIPLFLHQLKRNKQLYVTHPDMTRYLMTAFEAGQLLLETSVNGTAGQIFIPHMGSPVHITTLAERLLNIMQRRADILFTSVRPGEKLFETLLNEDDVLLPSYHPEIFVTQPKKEKVPDIDKFLSQFKKALYGCDTDLLLSLLISAVPEYTPGINADPPATFE